VWDWLRSLFGEVTRNEVILVAIIFLCIMAYSWAPRLGEAAAGLFEGDED
jgi:hypothetical protein